jgi:hypothetical protein
MAADGLIRINSDDDIGDSLFLTVIVTNDELQLSAVGVI